MSEEEEAQLNVLIAVTACLFDDTHRQLYLTVFMPAMAGPALDIGIDNAKGRRKVIDDICD